METKLGIETSMEVIKPELRRNMSLNIEKYQLQSNILEFSDLHVSEVEKQIDHSSR